jgi:hypothetical protein
MTSSLRRLGVLVAGLVLVAGCSQEPLTGPTAPAAPAAQPSATLLGDLTSTLGLTSANGLLRTTPLAEDITVVETIGTAGGKLSIPAAGVTVVIPAGALSTPTEITMTARKGSLVAYDFAPHGITFARPLVFTQKLSGTRATLFSALGLKLAYYKDPSLLGATTALVSELVSGLFNVLNWSFNAPIRHFSGYMVTCGRGGESSE